MKNLTGDFNVITTELKTKKKSVLKEEKLIKDKEKLLIKIKSFIEINNKLRKDLDELYNEYSLPEINNANILAYNVGKQLELIVN